MYNNANEHTGSISTLPLKGEKKSQICKELGGLAELNLDTRGVRVGVGVCVCVCARLKQHYDKLIVLIAK